MKLKATFVLSLLAGCALFSTPVMAQADTAVAPAAPKVRTDLPKATDIFEKSMKAYGGRDKINGIKTLRTVMSAEMMGTSVSMDNAWQRDGGRRVIMTMPMGKQEMGSDGKVAWMNNPMGGYTLLDGDMADQVNGQAEMYMIVLDPITQMKKQNSKADTIGKETFNDHDCYVIQITEEDGDTSRVFYDVETSKVLGVKSGSEPEITTVSFKDWKNVDGIQFFHTMEMVGPQMPMPMVFSMTDIQVNTLDADYFAMPAEVKKLADEKAASKSDSDNGEIKLSDLNENGRALAEMQLKAILLQSPTAAQLKEVVSGLEQGLGYMPADQKKVYEYMIQELKKEIAKKG
ncbi:MAG: hypothetical protein H6815_04980 [Phycisphaeraceae bacterium]|nr:hypothetical protein [Phycisphaerales bacterium]MCB9859789.1 hypothetical protein [Phycisphaeraceae bacterium]